MAPFVWIICVVIGFALALSAMEDD